MNQDFPYSTRSRCPSSHQYIDPQVNTDDDPQEIKAPSISSDIVLKKKKQKVKQQSKAKCKRMQLTQAKRDKDSDNYQIRKKVRIKDQLQDHIESNSDGNFVQGNFNIMEHYQHEFQCHTQMYEIESLEKDESGAKRESHEIPAIENFSTQKLELDLIHNKNDMVQGNRKYQHSHLLKYNVPKTILDVLDGLNFQEMFQKDLKEICQELKLRRIIIYKIDLESEQIFFQIVADYFDENIINARIQDTIIDQLTINKVDLDHLLFQEHFQNKNLLEQEFSCYIYLNDEQKFQYVTLIKYKDQIQQAINQMTYQKQIKKKIIIKQNIIFQKLVKIMKNTKQSKVDIEFKYMDNTIQLSGCQEYVDKGISEIQEMQNNLEEQIHILRMNISEKLWKMLEIKQKDNLQQIMNKNQSFYQYSVQSIEQDSQIVANLRFNNKLISIEYVENMNQADIIQDSFNELNNHIFRAEQDFQKQRIKILKIFQEAEKNNQKSLTLPILTGEQSSLLIKTAYRSFIQNIIILTKNSLIVDKITIIEINSQKINLLVHQLKDILYPLGIQEQNLERLTNQFQQDYQVEEQNFLVIQDEQDYQVEEQDIRNVLNRFDFKIGQISQLKEKQVSIDIKSLDAQNLEQVKLEIDNCINKNQVIFKWKVLNLKMDDLIEIEDFIINNSFSFEGEIKAGNEILIKCSQKKLIKIQRYLINILREKIIYPESWVYQDKNFVKIRLNPDDDEYKQVEEKFLQGYRQGRIYQINRIQNKWLYENFINEQNRLLAVKQNQGKTLTKSELNMSLWHGVKFNNPSIVYESENEAFKSNFSRFNPRNGNALGSWGGPATYFAEKSLYSKMYAYQLKPEDSVYFQGKFSFLLCQVTTGQCVYSSPNSELREPPEGYDCVVGTNNNSQIFVLYGMDSRRAYPGYEVIFE